MRAKSSVAQMIEGSRAVKKLRRKHREALRAEERRRVKERLKKSLEQSHIVLESGSSIKFQGPVTEEMKSGLEIHEEDKDGTN